MLIFMLWIGVILGILVSAVFEWVIFRHKQGVKFYVKLGAILWAETFAICWLAYILK